MSKIPKITVLMSVYNGDKYLSETIESVLKQSFSDFEFLIIDDGSIDNSRNIIQGYEDDRIKYCYKHNSGIAKSLNYGLKIAEGKYIARIDADDICYQDRLVEQYNFMEMNSEYVICGSACDVVDVNNEFLYKYNDLPFTNDDIFTKMKKRNCFVHSSTFFRKEVALEIGGYYEPIRQYFEDYMLFNQMIKYGKSYNFQNSLIRYRVVPGSISSGLFGYKYKNIIKNVVTKGFANNKEIEFLKKLKSTEDEKRKLSNYHCLMFRLLLSHQLSFRKSFVHISKAISIDPSNINSYASLLYGIILILKFLKKSAVELNSDKKISR